MTEAKKVYEFGEFRLDIAREVLERNGSNIQITRKVFETLRILVENSDRLLEKRELMELIWHDRFVEESNLTFNIKMLRKALGDDAANPTYIETIPRRGYRFIAEVREAEVIPKVTAPLLDAPGRHQTSSRRSRSPYLLAAVVAIALVGSLGFASLIWRTGLSKSNDLIFPNGFQSTRISDTGRVHHAVISPDGKYVAYTNIINGKQSLWLRHLETASNTPILPPSDDIYYGLTFSKTGDAIYFVRREDTDVSPSVVYRIPVFGGVPAKLVERIQGWISVSPDDKQISFVRTEPSTHTSHLFVANTDGSNEREVSVAESPNYFWSHAFSPDGKSIAAAFGHSANGAQNMGLVEIDLTTGERREISRQKFFHIQHVEWLPNGSGLIFTADKAMGETVKVWQVNRESGGVTSVTSGLTGFKSLSITRDGSQILATTFVPDFHLFIGDQKQTGDFRSLTQARDRFVFTPDGKIVYASDAAGNEDIWIMDADGSNQRQLTNDSSVDFYPLVSSDGRHIYFTSNRTGESHVWRINIDGSNPTQITRGDGGFPLFVPIDNKSIYYQSALSDKVKQVSLESGDDVELQLDTGYFQSFSPDGKLIASLHKPLVTVPTTIKLINVETGEVVKVFPVPHERGEAYYLRWQSNDTFGYSMNAKDAADSIWIQKITEDEPKVMLNLSDDGILDLQFSPDGRTVGFIRGTWKHDAVLLTADR